MKAKFDRVLTEFDGLYRKLKLAVKDDAKLTDLLTDASTKHKSLTKADEGFVDRLMLHEYTVDSFLTDVKGKEAQARHVQFIRCIICLMPMRRTASPTPV